MLKTIISWSGGKDSTATIILAHQMGLPVDEIIISEVMYDNIRGISGESPEFIEWVKGTAIPRIEAWGYKVTVLHAERDFLSLFFRRNTRGNPERLGLMHGYFISGRCEGNRELKMKPIRDFLKSQTEPYQQFIGIAADEPKRLARLKGNERSLLAECNMTEADARRLCEEHGLLAPTYKTQKRQGCWFCPNAGISSYAQLAQNHPSLYEEFVGLGGVNLLITKKFKWNVTISEWDRQVRQYIENQHRQGQFNFEGDTDGTERDTGTADASEYFICEDKAMLRR